MREIDFFRKSFNFDNNIVKKIVYILRPSAPLVNTLPIEIIREIVNMLAFKKPGYYYKIQDNFRCPNKVNIYLGKYIENYYELINVSYNGWTDDFNENVPLKNITYLTKDDIPNYNIGDYLDIKHSTPSINKWYVGIIWDIKYINDEMFLTILYKIKFDRKLMIAIDVPIYYKYISPMRLHTKHWASVIPTDFKYYLTSMPISSTPIQWAQQLATERNYTLHKYIPL